MRHPARASYHGVHRRTFAPALHRRHRQPAAGAYTPFTLTFSRQDGEQDLSGLTVNMPYGPGSARSRESPSAAKPKRRRATQAPGLATARIGTATAAAGAGADPFWQSGPVYLTGPYDGAPFGLAVVVPANAGPFHLGNIVVRAAIHINPETAAVSVVSEPLAADDRRRAAAGPDGQRDGRPRKKLYF